MVVVWGWEASENFYARVIDLMGFAFMLLIGSLFSTIALAMWSSAQVIPAAAWYPAVAAFGVMNVGAMSYPMLNVFIAKPLAVYHTPSWMRPSTAIFTLPLRPQATMRMFFAAGRDAAKAEAEALRQRANLAQASGPRGA